MTQRFGLRARLTIFVTAIFAVTLTVVAIVAMKALESGLVASTRSNAEAVLANYVESSSGVVSGAAVVDPAETTRFFYLDENGDELTEEEYFSALITELDPPFDVLPADGLIVSGPIPSDIEVVGDGATTAPPFVIDSDSGDLVGPDGNIVVFELEPIPEGDPHSVDLGNDVVAVAQTVTFSDGKQFEVGVSSPLRAVSESLDSIRRLLWLAVPLLSLVTALITWLAATRALKPVHALTRQARGITTANIGDRLPVHAARDEIRDLATTMNDMLERLDSSQRRQRQFISDASHELRSPVAASRVQLEVAHANADNTDWKSTAELVLAEQEYLSGLIDDLLALSRLDETGVGSVVDVDLEDMVLAEARRPRQLEVTVSIPAPVRISGNLSLLTSAVRNLIDNASRHAESRVEVALSVDRNRAVLHVDDDGPGVESASRQLIFDRFVRLDDARSRQRGGSGLGLAITKEVAEAHGGDVRVVPGPLGGARFVLRLPLDDQPPSAG